MSITVDNLQFLTSATGEKLLRILATEDLSASNTLSLITQLRKEHSLSEVSAALSTARLRKKAVDKFGNMAAQMLFTDDALQQASHPAVRRYRSGRFRGNGLDLCCGIGADSLAFASHGLAVLGADIDPLRIKMAAHNARVCGLEQVQFIRADITQPEQNSVLQADFDFIFFDPSRRDATGKRIYNVDHYLPPLSVIHSYNAPVMVVKLSPGVDLAQIRPYPAYVEFISVSGELKEAILWFEGDFSLPVATLIMDDEAIYRWQRYDEEPDVAVAEPLNWLVEPDPAIIRAGLVKDVAATFGGVMLDESIAYFTTANKPDSPWVRCWEILDWMPFNLKKLRAYLRERNIGTITVKKRGSPLTPEELIRKLKLKGDNSCTVVLTRLKNDPFILICEDYTV